MMANWRYWCTIARFCFTRIKDHVPHIFDICHITIYRCHAHKHFVFPECYTYLKHLNPELPLMWYIAGQTSIRYFYLFFKYHRTYYKNKLTIHLRSFETKTSPLHFTDVIDFFKLVMSIQNIIQCSTVPI